MLPDVPTIYYLYCPSCHKVGDVLLEDLERLEDDTYKYDCECGFGQGVHKDKLPTDEREVWRLTIDNMQGHTMDLAKRYAKLRLANNQINTMLFIIEKGAKDIIKQLEKEDKDEANKHAMYEAKDLLQYILKEQDKATNNGKEIEKKAKTQHWSDFVHEVFKEDEQATQDKDS